VVNSSVYITVPVEFRPCPRAKSRRSPGRAAFGGAFLAWWSGNELTRSDLHRAEPVREALQAAVEVAALTCTHVGAEPPWLAEVRGRPGWRAYGET